MPVKSFGERLCQLRESKGWLQRDLAFRVGVKANTISNWEKGVSRPNMDQICQLCQTLSVTSDTLLGLDKAAMERTLSIAEQHVINIWRSIPEEMRKMFFSLIATYGRVYFDLSKKELELEEAEEYIKASGWEDDWEKIKKERIAFDEDC